jgi:hypothetical protein
MGGIRSTQFQLKPANLGGQLVGRQSLTDIQESSSSFNPLSGDPSGFFCSK